MPQQILSIFYAILSAPVWLLVQPLRLLSRWSGGAKALTASISQNVAATVICGSAGWLLFGAGAYFANPWRESWPDPCTGEKFCIVIAGLQDDDEIAGRQTKHVRASLEAIFATGDKSTPVQIVVIPRQLGAGFGGDAEAQRTAAETKGRSWLSRLKGDVLIYGEVAAEDKVLELRVVAAGRDTSGGDRYPLDSKLTLPQNFNNELGAAVAAVALTAAAPVANDEGHYLVPLLKPIAAKLERLNRHMPLSLPKSVRAQVSVAYAMALQSIGEQSGDSETLRKAIAAYREALNEYTRKRVPLEWAMTQNNLGNALSILGEREKGTARLAEAVTAYREALTEYTHKRVPLDWAMTQNNLGNALSTLGEREGGTTKLEEAVIAYREALKEHSRERVPLKWAMTQNNLGIALSILGERESRTKRLEESVAALRQALRERTRERVPLAWAMTQNNLGTALQALGEREKGTARIEDAVAAFSAALEIFEASGAGYYIEIARSNLAGAEILLAKRRTAKQ